MPAAGSALDTWADAPCGLLRLDDRGLVVAANRRLLDMLGYSEADVVGRMNWNDLMAVGSRLFYLAQLAPVLQLNGRLDEVMLDLRAASGERVPVLVNAVRRTDDNGREQGAQIALMNVPDRRAYENELRKAREQAEQARAADARARLRLELLARANTALASSMDVEVALGRLARVLVEEFVDWCVIYTDDPVRPEEMSWAAAHTLPERQPKLERLAALLPQHVPADSPVAPALHRGEVLYLPVVTEQHRRRSTDSVEVAELYDALGLGSCIIIPSRARAARVATIILARDATRPPFRKEDVDDLTDLAARTGIVIDNLRRHAKEHSNSVALQQALLTSPPSIAGLQLVTRYLPAADGNQVGGDWYDVFLQRDGTVVLVIGDVVGHDIAAAAAMGQLRGVIRTVGYTHGGSAADILTDADTAARGLSVAEFATAIVARIQVGTTGPRTLEWANAGHPPGAIVGADGAPRLLDAPPDLPLGIGSAAPRTNHTLTLADGDSVFLYTDGLIERTDEGIDTGLARLLAALAGAHERSLDRICDAAVLTQSTHRDDIALLAARLLPSPTGAARTTTSG